MGPGARATSPLALSATASFSRQGGGMFAPSPLATSPPMTMMDVGGDDDDDGDLEQQQQSAAAPKLKLSLKRS